MQGASSASNGLLGQLAVLELSCKCLLSKFTLGLFITPDLNRVRKQDADFAPPLPLLDRSFTAQEKAPSRTSYPEPTLSEATPPLGVALS